MFNKKEQLVGRDAEKKSQPIRTAEVIIDQSNPPQLVNIIPHLDRINAFFNEREGSRQGPITITLAGSSSENLRKAFSNRDDINWKELVDSTIRHEWNVVHGASEQESGNIEIFVDDILYWEIIESIFLNDQLKDHEVVQVVRDSFEGTKSDRLHPGFKPSKTLQHELDHSAKTGDELIRMHMLAPRYFTRTVSLVSFFGLWGAAALYAKFDTNISLAITGGVAFSVFTYVDYIKRYRRGELPDYDLDPVEISARQASIIDQKLLTVNLKDRLWLIEQEHKAVVSFNPNEWQVTPHSPRVRMHHFIKRIMEGKREY